MDTTMMDPKLLNSHAFQSVLADALAIQDRFAAEPVYTKTEKGFLKSAGVAELKEIKATQQKKSRSSHDADQGLAANLYLGVHHAAKRDALPREVGFA